MINWTKEELIEYIAKNGYPSAVAQATPEKSLEDLQKLKSDVDNYNSDARTHADW